MEKEGSEGQRARVEREGAGRRGVLAHAGHQCVVDDADADLRLLGLTTQLRESRPGEGLAQCTRVARGLGGGEYVRGHEMS